LAQPAIDRRERSAVSEMLGSFDNLARGISALIYGAIMLFGILIPGCTALYYARDADTSKRSSRKVRRGSSSCIVEESDLAN